MTLRSSEESMLPGFDLSENRLSRHAPHGPSRKRAVPEAARKTAPAARVRSSAELLGMLREFDGFGSKTLEQVSTGVAGDGEVTPIQVPCFINEYWTSAQRAASNFHEISYRACFKPQLPRFFIERLTDPGQRVYDPFMGRGTTPVEAALLGRVPCGCDVNPLSVQLVRPRLAPPKQDEVLARLNSIPWDCASEVWDELLVFYHPQTLRQLTSLKQYLQQRKDRKTFDAVDDWIAMVALNRLTGHSVGFFSVYTLPPNQAASVKSQKRINERRDQTPPLRDVPAIIAKKSAQLMKDLDEGQRSKLIETTRRAQLLVSRCNATPELADGSVDLVVTSPPFLDIVQYAADNWLRCWFMGVDSSKVEITTARNPAKWADEMALVFRELYRVVRKGGWVAFEVGEVNKGKVKLEEWVLPCGRQAGFRPVAVMVNAQEFTKTANCWGVDNNSSGTNTNRIVLFQK